MSCCCMQLIVEIRTGKIRNIEVLDLDWAKPSQKLIGLDPE